MSPSRKAHLRNWSQNAMFPIQKNHRLHKEEASLASVPEQASLSLVINEKYEHGRR
jgi:hypothetical protein